MRARINGQIEASIVKVVSEDGADIGLLSISDALKLVASRREDLVEIKPNIFPPLCQAIDYGKYRDRLLRAEIARLGLDSKPGDTWPFDQPRKCATITVQQVLDHSESILLVSHDADDHGWQFIGTTDANVNDARVVCLEEIVYLDHTVLEVADLPPGWQAFREGLGSPWNRRLRPEDSQEAAQ